LIWDDEARGLCVRVYPDGAKSFIFLYHINGRQRFIRIGCSPGLSLKAARNRAQELRRIVLANDHEAFTRMFEEVRRHFGGFTKQALDQSSYLIDRLVERA